MPLPLKGPIPEAIIYFRVKCRLRIKNALGLKQSPFYPGGKGGINPVDLYGQASKKT